MNQIVAPMSCIVVSIDVGQDELVAKDQVVAKVEAMKMQYAVKAPSDGRITVIQVAAGDVLEQGDLICRLAAQKPAENAEVHSSLAQTTGAEVPRQDLAALKDRLANTQDSVRLAAKQKRHSKGYRTARENLEDLIDEDSFIEYGQLCVAAQRSRRDLTELQTETAADGVITGTANINGDLVDDERARTAIVINDYSVLAGTQGHFHHRKLDRILELAEQWCLPVIMYTEGGGGRPGDTDIMTNMAGLNVSSFKTWASLSGHVPRIAVNNGNCFAGNAALFGCADITIATKNSNIGMAGPAMIEGGGLGSYTASEIGPIEVQSANGVVDLVADDEAHATALAKQCLSYFQGKSSEWQLADPTALRDVVPAKRRAAYQVRDVIKTVFDSDSFLELRQNYGQGMVTGFARIQGRPVGVLANDCHHLGGAVDAVGAEKAARFIQLCDAFDLPIVSFTDTPGFMVGPQSEEQASVRRMSSLFVCAASIQVPVVAIVLRKAYGLGAMAMTGGSMFAPVYTAAWPSGEFGAMGLEGAVRLGYRKELAAEPEGEKRQALFDKLLQQLIDQGKATEAAAFQEIDAVIDPADTRDVIIQALHSSLMHTRNHRPRRNFVDTR